MPRRINDNDGKNLAGYPIPNANSIQTVRVLIPALNTPVKLPQLGDIPDDMSMVIKADPANPVGFFVLLASTRAKCLSRDQSWPLQPNEGISYRIQGTTSLWVSATAVPAWVCITSEYRGD